MDAADLVDVSDRRGKVTMAILMQYFMSSFSVLAADPELDAIATHCFMIEFLDQDSCD
jgi:hypothetical protein